MSSTLKHAKPMIKALVSTLGASLACTLAATADVTLNYNGTDYQIGTITGTFKQYSTLLESQPWFIDAPNGILDYDLIAQGPSLAGLGFYNQPASWLPAYETQLLSPLWLEQSLPIDNTAGGAIIYSYNTSVYNPVGWSVTPDEIVTFAVVVTPEPASYVMAAGVSLAMIGLCRRSGSKKA